MRIRRLPVQQARRSQRPIQQPDAPPRAELARRPDDRLYVAATRGFRPPEATELYRLQRQQRVADLDSERLASIEIGWRHETPRQAWSLAAYAMTKSNVILRDADGFNVGDGRTTHRGLEYELRGHARPGWQLSASGSFARHRYAFSRSIEGGETIVAGRDVDTAPRQLHHAALGWRARAGLGRGTRTAACRRVLRRRLQPQSLSRAHARQPAHRLAAAALARTLRVSNLRDRAYADRADFAQGDWRYFPGRGRSAFLEFEVSARRAVNARGGATSAVRAARLGPVIAAPLNHAER